MSAAHNDIVLAHKPKSRCGGRLRLRSELPVRCHYMSDLHLESQDFPWRLPQLRQEGPSARAMFDVAPAPSKGPRSQSVDFFCVAGRNALMLNEVYTDFGLSREGTAPQFRQL